MGTTTDPDDPRLGHGVDSERIPQHEAYLVLSDEERSKGFVRPVMTKYRHVGLPGPDLDNVLRDLTAEEIERWGHAGYVKFEEYAPEKKRGSGRFWTQERLDKIGKGCGAVTTMGTALAETYARNPNFYGATFCVNCSMHLAVGEDGEFLWECPGTMFHGLRVGT